MRGLEVKEMARPGMVRFGPSLVAYRDMWIFVLGGKQLHSVEAYSIAEDKWLTAPNLNRERTDASSCEL